MDLIHIALLCVCLCTTITVVFCDNDQHDIIQYLERIEKRITGLEGSLARRELLTPESLENDSDGSNYQDNGQKSTAPKSRQQNRQKRASLASRNGSPRIPADVSKLNTDIRCMDRNFNQISDRFKSVSMKFDKASDALDLVEKRHFDPLQRKLEDMKDSMDALIYDLENSDGDKPGFVTIDAFSGVKLFRISCRKRPYRYMDEELRRNCETILLNGGDVVDALECCHSTELRPPIVSVSQSQRTVSIGDKVTIKCEVDVESKRPVYLTWEKHSGRMPKSIEIDGGKLTITNVLEGDFGKYVCKASNIAGTATAETILKKGPGQCQAIQVPLCKDISYSLTSFPNMFGHKNQEVAGMMVHQFFPLVKVQCSKDLKHFLCSMYTPIFAERNSGTIPPCRSLCERAKDGCESLMNKFGFEWPSTLQCDKISNTDELCLERNVDGDGSRGKSAKDNRNLHTIPKSIKCERIHISQCSHVGYSHTFMPNMQNQSSQEEAARAMDTLSGMIIHDCYSDLSFLMCNMFTPMCSVGTYIPVCRSVCERVRRSCEKAFIDWPASLDCSLLPVQSDTAFCLERGLTRG